MKDSQTTTFDWYAMKLGDMYPPDNNSIIIRVPGGWVYGNMHGTCFIPFNNEFMTQEALNEEIPF